MGRESIGGVATEWESGWETDMSDTSFEGYTRTILSPHNYPALNWARRCVELCRAYPADVDDLCTFIDRLHWPTEPGCRSRED